MIPRIHTHFDPNSMKTTNKGLYMCIEYMLYTHAVVSTSCYIRMLLYGLSVVYTCCCIDYIYKTCPFTVKDWAHLVYITHVLSLSKIEHTSFISDMSFHCQTLSTPRLYQTCPFTVKNWAHLVYIRHVLRDFQCTNIKHFEKGQR